MAERIQLGARVRFKYRGRNDKRKRYYEGRVRELGACPRVEWEMDGVLNVCSFAADELEPVPLRVSECIGREATARCDITNKGGAHIKPGERVRITGAWRGEFDIEAADKRYVRRVPRAWLDMGGGQ